MLNKNSLLKEFLSLNPISYNRAFELSKVNRTTFKRWYDGESNPPVATLELLRLHANYEPPSLIKEWQGWAFKQGKLWTPANDGFAPFEIAQIPAFYRDRRRLQNIEQNYALQSKLF